MGLAVSQRSVVGVMSGDTPRVIRRTIPRGLVEPAVATPNIRSVAELALLVEEVLAELGARRRHVALVLPDLCVTTVLFPDRGGESDKKLWGELGRSLAFPRAEARHDFWRGRGKEVLGAAVRETVVRQYEQAVEASDYRLGWVDAASLVKLPGWAAPSSGDGLDVQTQLYQGHYSIFVFRNGVLVDARTKLRAPGDVRAVERELLRLPRLHEVEKLGSLTLRGEDASSLATCVEGVDDVGRVQVVEDGEDPLLASCVVELLGRPA